MPRSISIDSITCDAATAKYTASGDCSDPTKVKAELRAPGVVSPLFPVHQDGGTKWHVEFPKSALDPELEYEVFAQLDDGQLPAVTDTEPVPPCSTC